MPEKSKTPGKNLFSCFSSLKLKPSVHHRVLTVFVDPSPCLTQSMSLCIYIINLDCLYFTDQNTKKAAKKKKKTSTKKDELLSITTQHDELVITDILSSTSPLLPPLPNPPEAIAADNNPRDVVLAVLNGSSTPEPALLKPQAEKKLQHPHFGGKQPKQHKPLKCISTVCKEEKDKLAEELESTREELDKALEELSKC